MRKIILLACLAQPMWASELVTKHMQLEILSMESCLSIVKSSAPNLAWMAAWMADRRDLILKNINYNKNSTDNINIIYDVAGDLAWNEAGAVIRKAFKAASSDIGIDDFWGQAWAPTKQTLKITASNPAIDAFMFDREALVYTWGVILKKLPEIKEKIHETTNNHLLDINKLTPEESAQLYENILSRYKFIYNNTDNLFDKFFYAVSLALIFPNDKFFKTTPEILEYNIFLSEDYNRNFWKNFCNKSILSSARTPFIHSKL